MAPDEAGVSDLRLTDAEWDALELLDFILEVRLCLFILLCILTLFTQVPHRSQMKLAAEKSPSLCDFIAEIETIMTEWENMSETYPETSEAIKEGCDKIIKYYNKLDDCNAYVISMCESRLLSILYFQCLLDLVLHPCHRFKWIEANWGGKYDINAKLLLEETVSICLRNVSICLMN